MFVQNQVYRRRDLHARYKGLRQGSGLRLAICCLIITVANRCESNHWDVRPRRHRPPPDPGKVLVHERGCWRSE